MAGPRLLVEGESFTSVGQPVADTDVFAQYRRAVLRFDQWQGPAFFIASPGDMVSGWVVGLLLAEGEPLPPLGLDAAGRRRPADSWRRAVECARAQRQAYRTLGEIAPMFSDADRNDR